MIACKHSRDDAVLHGEYNTKGIQENGILRSMGLFIRQNENRSHLQERLAAELREKAKLQQQNSSGSFDQTKDSGYVKDTEQTSRSAGAALLVAVLVVVGVVIFVATR